jgi:hypothetical protein
LKGDWWLSCCWCKKKGKLKKKREEKKRKEKGKKRLLRTLDSLCAAYTLVTRLFGWMTNERRPDGGAAAGTGCDDDMSVGVGLTKRN